MKKYIGIALVGLVAFALTVFAAQEINNALFKGDCKFDTGSIVDILGTWKINGTAVTATGAQINNMATQGSTNATLNPLVISNVNLVLTASNLVSGTGGSISGPLVSATTVSNLTGKVYGSNLVVGVGGSIKIGADAGLTRSLTNAFVGYTNVLWYSCGIVTNITSNP